MEIHISKFWVINEVSFLSAISIVSSVILISLALLGAPVLLANIFESFVFVFLGFLGVIMLIYEYNEVRHRQIHTIQYVPPFLKMVLALFFAEVS